MTKAHNPLRNLKTLLLATSLSLLGTGLAQAHGDVTPQAVDVSTLKKLGADWLVKNPYSGDQEAVRIGKSAFTQNCARCHGIDAISGGIAPDLRYLPKGQEGDEIFLQRIRHGSTRDGRVYMPPFEGVFSQEAMWAIRSWLETVYVE
jgi:cytochrome c-550 PedF